MHIRGNVIWFILLLFGNLVKCDLNLHNSHHASENLRSTYTVLSESISDAVKNENQPEICDSEDVSCFAMGSQDRLGLEAIQDLHNRLDDDRNGNVDLTETDDFLREELKYDSGYEKRQKVFHKNDDTHISVKELWEAWLKSEVHNWTTQQTSEWLAVCVELPQYINNFLRHKVSGAMLPRLAVNMALLNTLGIKDPIHKQKIALKAMDVVLFGPPKDHHPHWKDLTLIALIVGGGIGVWYALQQNKKFKAHLNRMYKDMEGLQHAETALEDMQKELEQAVQARENVVSEKQTLEKKLQEAAGGETTTMHNSFSDLEVAQLKAEIEMLRHDLQIAEGELKDRCWSPPLGLQQWLQLTHEIENKAYMKKRLVAEKQLQQAREACEKLRKKRSSLVGAFVSTHGKSIDDVDRSIVEARTSLNEVTHELQERMYRWKQIELCCGFNIINNNGLQQLENILYRNSNINGRTPLGIRGRMSSQDDLDDDTSSIYTATGYIDTGAGSVHSWREADSSGSETSKQEDEIGINSRGVNFLVGGEVSAEEPMLSLTKHSRAVSQSPLVKSVANSIVTKNMIRSYSQDVNVMAAPENMSTLPKSAFSEPALDFQVKPKNARQKTIQEQASVALEDEVYSTDSSLAEEEIKKRKRKLFGFSKKNKVKGD